MAADSQYSDPDLNAREMMVLSAVVRDYTALALPVSSQSISRSRGIRVSPATVRSIMKRLETLGLIRQPHTSAGRIPTDRGYRYFVDHIMKPAPLPARFRESLEDSVGYTAAEVDAILEQACRTLSHVSRQLGVVMAPRFDNGIFKKLELVPVAQGKVLLVLTIGSGLVRTVVARILSPLSALQLERTAAFITERLQGISLKSLREQIGTRLRDAGAADPAVIRVFTDSLEYLAAPEQQDRVYWRGSEHIVTQPEFLPAGRLEKVFTCIEDAGTCRRLMHGTAATDERTGVRIGTENSLTAMEHCSLVVSSYRVGNMAGTIGLVGPTRMEYTKLVPLVGYMGRLLSRVL